MSFELLSQPIRQFVREQRWESLRPIQAAAISKILTTEHNYILASRTASGKTEAAFLPILSRVNFNEPGVQVVYISPLIALINDQVNRVEELCKYLDVVVTKWHGEAKKSLKDRIIKEPSGIVLITPESLEAMFVNKQYQVKHLFSNIKYVVIDEIHSFIGSDRGIQLKSILSRLQNFNNPPFKIIGLSATIGDYQEAKNFTGNSANTKVLLDRTAKEIKVVFRYFEGSTTDLSNVFLNDLYQETKDNKVLIFPNSRARVEEVAVGLKKIAEKQKGHSNYFSHHSSVDREVREYVEYFAKNNNRQNFTIACTSTLELGIDIGAVDEVIQIDSTHSIASLIQRVGRSGRRHEESSNLFLYATHPWALLQSIACWELFTEGFIEPPFANSKPYDIMLHQALSIVKGSSGVLISDLILKLKTNYAFTGIQESEIAEILNHLIETDLLEKIQLEVIIGISAERIVNDKDFYSVFKTEENYKVINNGNKIGDLPFTPQVIPDENILLAAKIWKIKYVDHKSKKIEVTAARDGKKPYYLGDGANIHPAIIQKMLDILYTNNDFTYLESGKDAIDELRSEFSAFAIQNTKLERPVRITEKGLEVFLFAGSAIEDTLLILCKLSGIKVGLNARSIDIELGFSEFIAKFPKLTSYCNLIDPYLEEQIREVPGYISFSKWGSYLPLKYQVQLYKSKRLDIIGAIEFIERTKFVSNEEDS